MSVLGDGLIFPEDVFYVEELSWAVLRIKFVMYAKAALGELNKRCL